MKSLIRLALLLFACLVSTPLLAECRLDALDRLAERSLLHRPARAASDMMPLVVLLHGSTSDGEHMLRESGLARTADRHGFLVVAPNGGIAAGQGFVWNIPGVPTVTGSLPPKGARDDVAYLHGLVDRLVATGCVDGARVYATGLSGGGRMTSLLGCRLSGSFAAIAPVVGLRAGRPSEEDPAEVDPASCRPAKAIPLLAFSGDADTTNPIAGGGAPYWRYSQAAALRRWATLNRCTTAYSHAIDGMTYEQGYEGCTDDATVAARVRRGGGHSWSVVDNDALWAFFSRHHR